ncbi:TolB-like 6-bladed beta-propeller domain-containing protein [Belliella sp. R4-6]|uniref:TolB-like 6-bladed beta-propeller domain-containing protein n=1 Tax=Belliella alkalica TaxID=1730871 RepID=A0ABS9V9P4_9BACT|nr:BF3164 family lipoprotein [Belliella alkalica]MCH7412815.1 TolB-like 6-bladed beta-propeller domain-containing protein [Belliella alkalica]
MTAEKINTIEEDNEFSEFAVVGSNLILLDRSQSEIFQVYSTSNFEKLGSFGKEGDGPEDFSLPKFVKNSVSGKSDEFWIFDPNKKRFQKIKVDKNLASGYSLQENIIMDPKILGSFDINIMPSGKIIGKNPIEGKGSFYLFDPETRELTWQEFHPKIPEESLFKKSKSFVYNSLILHNEKNKKIAQAMYYFNQVHIYDENANLEKTFTLGDLITPDLSEESRSFIPPSILNNFVDLKATDAHIYALYIGLKQSELRENPVENFYSTVYKLDWNGNLIETYKLELLLNLIALDPLNNKIYGLHFKSDKGSFERVPEIYQYNVPID